MISIVSDNRQQIAVNHYVCLVERLNFYMMPLVINEINASSKRFILIGNELNQEKGEIGKFEKIYMEQIKNYKEYVNDLYKTEI